MTQEKSSPKKPAEGGKKPYRKRRRKYSNKKNNTKKEDGSVPQKNQVQASAGNNKHKSKNRNRNRRNQKSLSPSKLQQKYDNLLEQYLMARKKLFHVQGKINPKQLQKSQKSYQLAITNLRKFETSLKDWQIEALKQKLNFYPEDRQFSTTHELDQKGDDVSFSGEFPDPHLLPMQKDHAWSNDTEESSGTIEDYIKYKESI